MNNTKYSLYVKFISYGTEIKIGEYTNKKFANEMFNKAADTWGYAKLTYTTKKGIEVIKIKRKKLYYR